MNLLAFDTSGPVISVGIVSDGSVLAKVEHRAERGRGNLLEFTIDEALRKADWSRNDIQGLGLVTGPGSLTALRIGWATAAAWAQAAQLPITGWSVPSAHRRMHGSMSEAMACCIHYRGDQFLLYALASPDSTPHSFHLGDDQRMPQSPSVLTGPAVVTHRTQLAERFGHRTQLVPDHEAIIGGEVLAGWAEVDISSGIVFKIDCAPIEYGLPPDFKKTALA